MVRLRHPGRVAVESDILDVERLEAEGVGTGVWQSYILPRMTVFQAKNGYGQGCPWACPHASEVDYSPEQFPVAEKHANSHTGMTMPLRSPNGPDVAELTAAGFRKVMENLDALDEVDWDAQK